MPSRKAAPCPMWVVVVRLAGGPPHYLGESSRHLRSGGQIDWTTRVSAADRFMTEDEARTVADRFETNTEAREYLVERLRR